MPTFQKCPQEVADLAHSIMVLYEDFTPLLDAKIKIDFVFAYPEYNDVSGEPLNNALTKNGCRALAICRKIPLKDRVLGRGDAEISIDGYWWDSADEPEQLALLDHELTHIVVTEKRDDIGRPVIKMRPHDFEFGWFASTAARHGKHSQERQCAAVMMERAGQFFWPEITGATNGRFGNLEMADPPRVHAGAK